MNCKEITQSRNNAVNKIRTDIAIAILLPYLICLFCSIFFLKHLPSGGFYLMDSIAAILVFIGLIIEIFTSNEHKGNGSKENGLLSAIITSFSFGSILTLSVAGVGVFSIHSAAGYASFIIGLVFFIAGSFIRLKAKRDLGRYFSHSLRITTNHELIQSGLYRYIRHPAYCGTSLVLVSVCLLFQNWISLLILLPLFCLGIWRINIEENMLYNQFGEDFVEYCKTTKRIIPFVY